jgi:hypothetical protein
VWPHSLRPPLSLAILNPTEKNRHTKKTHLEGATAQKNVSEGYGRSRNSMFLNYLQIVKAIMLNYGLKIEKVHFLKFLLEKVKKMIAISKNINFCF